MGLLPLLLTAQALAQGSLAAEPADSHARQREEIELLASSAELEVFDALTVPWRREAFLTRFWQLRDPFPQTARNELEERWEQRAELARQRFGSLADDRSSLLLLHGEPSEILTPRCGALLRPLELWSWERADLLNVPFTLVVKVSGTGSSSRGTLWDPIEGLGSLAAVPMAGSDDATFAQRLLDGCVGGTRVLEAFGRTVRWPLRGPERRTWPIPDSEWVYAFQDRSTELSSTARPLEGLGVEVSFPGRRQSRTVLRLDLSLPAESVEAQRASEPTLAEARASFRLLVDGEVLREGELFDSFRYRFELPVDGVGEILSMPVERALRPGRYLVALRARELGERGIEGRREARWEAELEIPVVAAVTAGVAPTGAIPAPSAGMGASTTDELDPVVRLMPPSPELLRGLVRVGASVSGPVAAVRFELDGKGLLTRTRAPWSVELDLGHVPKTRRLRAVGLDSAGAVVAEDAVLLNGGPHRFAIRLIEPSRGAATGTSVRVAAEVEVPERERLDRVEVFLNDDRVATLYQPPFETVLDLPKLEALGWIRVLAVLSDGSAAEDLVFVNAPDLLDRVDIDLVELYTTVVDRRGRPVEGLEREMFSIRENGRPQQLRRFDAVRDTPLHAGIILDVSGSMREQLPEAEAAAISFFNDLLRPTDRACVVTFADKPELQVRFTNDIEVLAGGLAGLHAYGNTALWDTVVYSLFYFNGVRGKRAMVLITDGEDSKSRHTFPEALDFARRSGVTIYTVSLGRAARQSLATSALARLASETGGRHYAVGTARDLREVYARIDAELRSQYLLAYQSDASLTDTSYREVEVEVRHPGSGKLEVRTLKGYFP